MNITITITKSKFNLVTALQLCVNVYFVDIKTLAALQGS